MPPSKHATERGIVVTWNCGMLPEILVCVHSSYSEKHLKIDNPNMVTVQNPIFLENCWARHTFAIVFVQPLNSHSDLPATKRKKCQESQALFVPSPFLNYILLKKHKEFVKVSSLECHHTMPVYVVILT